MANYFRITAYHPTENLSVIMDSNGLFEKLWHFSAYLVSKGFKIIAVGEECDFQFGNIPKIQKKYNKILLRACIKGKAKFFNNEIILGNIKYKIYNI